MTKRILALTLCAIMIICSMGLCAYATEGENGATQAESAFVVGGGTLVVGADYSTIYYGGIPWRVLDKEFSDGQEEAKNGILLLSEHAMANGIQYNAHYSNANWSATGKEWASAMVMPWDDERNPHYESNIANGTKTDDSSGGYLTSDVRMYLTGIGTYATFRPYAYYNESWPAHWWGTPDKNSKANKYYVRNEVTDTTPLDDVTYFVQDEFELSNHNRNNNEGWLPITAADFQENTWYTLDDDGNPVLLTAFPEDATTVNAYYDQAGYSIADVSDGFEDGVTYYTFERKTTAGDVLPTITTNGTEYTMGEHLASLYMFAGYSVPELANSNSANAITSGTFVAGLDASEKNFAADMGFSEIEKAAVLPTSGHGYNRGSGVNVGSAGTTFGDRLENDTYFSLSGEEVKVYLTESGHTKAATYFDGTTVGDIWTRSWGKADTQCVIVYTNNACSWRQGANNTWQSIRPAFNLNPDAVQFYAPVNDTEFSEVAESNNAYKLVLKDESRNFTAVPTTIENGIYKIAYKNAAAGDNEYISALIRDASGNIVAYGKAAAITDTNGEIEIDLSAYDMSDNKLYVFNEQCNGDRETNYASELMLIGGFACGDICYETFREAYSAAESNGTITFFEDASIAEKTVFNKENLVIDLNGYTLNMTAEPKGEWVDGDYGDCAYAFLKTTTFKDGTINVSNKEKFKNDSGVFYTRYTSLIFDNVEFISNGYNAFAMFNVSGPLKFVNGTVVNVENNADKNNFIYGDTYNSVTITDSEIKISNTGRGMTNVNLDADDSVIIISNLSDNALRNVKGTVTNTRIDANGYASGLKNDSDYALVVDGTSVVTLTGATGGGEYDLYLKSGAKLTVAEMAVFEAEKVYVEDENAVTGIVSSKADKIYVQYKKIDIDNNGDDNLEGSDKYEIVLAGADEQKIHELASADLKFDFVGTSIKGGAMSYFVEAAEGVSLSQLGDRFMFNYNGVDKYEESGLAIVIGTITIEGYGSYTLGTKDADTNAVYATEIRNNIVDGFEDAATLVINADLLADDGMTGKIDGETIEVPVRDLAINIDFPNAVANQKKAYQDMKVVISGGDLTENIEIELGSDAEETALTIAGKTDAKYSTAYDNNEYAIAVTDALTLNRAYTVAVSGAGYRTARYTVTMTKDKELNFWNNVMDEETAVEEGELSEKKNFLAGDIVKDNNINIYDLSAVVSYFGTEAVVAEESEYAKYDLNRDGVIDSRDVAYVLVSWGE